MSSTTRGLSRVAIVVLGALTLAGPVAAAATAAPPSTLGNGTHAWWFRDDFSSTPDPAWTFQNREGRIDAGRLWIDGGYTADSMDRDGWALTHVGNKRWRNYAFGFTYNSENLGGFPPDRHMATAYVRVSDASANVRRTMYRIDVWAAGDPYEGGGTCSDASHGYVTLGKYVDGVGYFLAEGCSSNSTPGTNRLVVTAHGDTISVTSNGARVLRYVDPAPLQYGGVGVGQIWETNGWFDDVAVQPVVR